MKKLLLLAIGIMVITIAMGVATSGTASAGEIAGNGERIEINGKSICAFSGLNDGFLDPEEPGFPEPNRTQTPGNEGPGGGPAKRITGFACNAHLFPYPPGPPHG